MRAVVLAVLSGLAAGAAGALSRCGSPERRSVGACLRSSFAVPGLSLGKSVNIAISKLLVPNLFSPDFNGMPATGPVCDIALYGNYKVEEIFEKCGKACRSGEEAQTAVELGLAPLCSSRARSLASGLREEACFGAHLRVRRRGGQPVAATSRAWEACEAALGLDTGTGWGCRAGARLRGWLACLGQLARPACRPRLARLTRLLLDKEEDFAC